MNLKDRLKSTKNKIDHLEKRKKTLEKELEFYNLLEAKYSDSNMKVHGKNVITCPSLLSKCDRLAFSGSYVTPYFNDGEIRVYGSSSFRLYDSTYRSENIDFMIYDYESFVPENFKDRKYVLKKIDKKIISCIKRMMEAKFYDYRSQTYSRYKFSLNKKSFNFDKFEGHLVFI